MSSVRWLFVGTGVLAIALLAIACSSTSDNSGGSGGAGAGGTGGGGTGGSAGGGGSGGTAGSVNYVDLCEPACTDAVSAGCTDTPSKQSCVWSCKALAGLAECQTEVAAYFTCIDGQTFTCVDNEAVIADCQDEYTKGLECATTKNPNATIVTPCNDLCQKIEALGCLADPPQAECVTNCLWAGAKGLECDTAWKTYLDCATKDTLACFFGRGVAPGCVTELKAYGQCLDNHG